MATDKWGCVKQDNWMIVKDWSAYITDYKETLRLSLAFLRNLHDCKELFERINVTLMSVVSHY